ncbi:HNH endonuclease family protein [Mucilaginibacter ginsenosidivorax]|uniref:TIGR02646 family protein n=1 Tax=Mucilaginibacter ginsenosidivorax TaxID=862126 RepID=A0A5B8W364_9SPHI|nr:hypothetical protein [Mucilaginibacter ginsenosidivorax]QEC78284.1 hypothetical protein FSB76_20925 [Mucilaginibacter ginsenosidivorax]
MIQLFYLRNTTVIHERYRGEKKKKKDKALLTARRLFLQDPKKPVTFSEAYWKGAKVQLKAETHRKCAYCEADTATVAHGDVEHYRPKSIYWWLAYTYDNYLFACQICNQTYKGDNFPIKGKRFPAPAITAVTTDPEIDALQGLISPDPLLALLIDYKLATYVKHHQAEQALLLNPYLDDPKAFIAYEADDIIREVSIVAKNRKAKPYIKAMEDHYGINRLELRNLRYKIFKAFRLFKKNLAKTTDPAEIKEIQEQIDEMLAPDYMFAGMNRYFNDKV